MHWLRDRQRLVWVVLAASLAAAAPGWANDCAFVAAGGLDAVSIVDVGADRITGYLPVGTRPVAVAVSADGRRAWVSNTDDHTVSVIDLTTRRAVATVAVGLFPTDVELHPDGSRVYVSDRRSFQLSVLDAREPRVIDTIDTQADGPSGIAITRDGRRAWVAHSFSARVVEIDLDRGEALGGATVGSTPYGLALSPDDAHVVVASLEAGTASVVRTADREVVATIPLGGNPTGAVFRPDGRFAYVSNAPVGSVAVIDTATWSAGPPIVLGPPESTDLAGIALSPDGTRAFAVDFIFGNLFAIDTARNVATGFAPVGGIASGPEGATIARIPGPCPRSPDPLLTAAVGESDDTVFLERADLLPVAGTLRLEQELITYDGRQLREAVVDVVRGEGGTEARAHAAGVAARLVGERGDGNCDGRVSAADFAAQAGQAPNGWRPCGADLDRDTVITPADVGLLVGEIFASG